jgi:phosphonate transport system substrate-binding protein
MICRPLRFVTFLAPSLYPVYQFVARRVSDALGLPTELVAGTSYAELAEADVGFVCGLAYVEVQVGAGVEPVAAPVLQGRRYGGRPVYFSDVIVRADSPFRTFADLRGRSWCYNEPLSHSGYGVARYRLVEMGETAGFFSRVVEAGWHQHSIRLVSRGEVDAAAIDSQVLALALRHHPELALQLRVLESLGPSTIQPVVVASWMPQGLRQAIRGVLLGMGDDPGARPALDGGVVERFVPVDDASYDDLRRMRAACAAANFLTLR